MEEKFRSHTFSDGSYSIGQLDEKYWPDGHAYMYWANTGVFAMGSFEKGQYHTWVCSNYSDSPDVISLAFYYAGKRDETMPNVYSTKNYIVLNDNKNKNKLIIWTDGGWRYQENSKAKNVKCVGYSAEDKKVYVGIMDNQNGKLLKGSWLNNRLSDCDFSIKYTPFSTETYPNPGGFTEHENQVDSKNIGPTICLDDENEEILIGINDSGWVGTLFRETDEQVIIKEVNYEKTDGPAAWVWSDGTAIAYAYNSNGHEEPVEAYISFEHDFCEIKNHTYTDEELYDSVYIDSDFNVTFYQQYDDDKEEAVEDVTFDFDEAMSDVEPEEIDEPEEKPKKARRGRTTTPTRNSKKANPPSKSKFDDYEEELIGFLLKNKKK